MKLRKRGGQPDYCRDRQGNLIVGLSCNACDGRFYATHSKPRKWFGRDFDLALIRFREWEAQTTGQRREVFLSRRALTPEESALLSAAGEENLPTGITYAKEGEVKVESEHGVESAPRVTVVEVRERVRDDLWWEQVTQAIREDPYLAAQKTGLPLDRLWQYRPVGPSPTLESVGEEYQSRSTATVEWKQKVKRYWKQFRKEVGVETVRELTQPLITKYADTIMDEADSPTYVGQRFGAVKTVLNFARTRGIAVEEIRIILDYCAVLKPPQKNGVNPQPISKAAFKALLAKADKTWKGLLLAALNFCMHGSEVAMLEWSDLDLQRKTLITDRNKTGVTRVATVWTATLNALKKLPRKHPQYVFISREGGPYGAEGIRTAFRKLRTKAGLGDEIQFNQIRDGSYSAAVEGAPVVEGKVIPTNAMLLAGHRTGMPDHYVRRNPRMVKDACDAVARYYGLKA